MCLIIFSWQPNAKRMLTLASNRDEFYERPSQDAHFWEDSPNIFGGRDLKMQGTWLAVSRNMRFAAITNFRSPESQTYLRSRGEIPHLFLNSTLSAIDYSAQIPKQEFAGFNALLFDGEHLVYCHNQKDKQGQYSAGTILPAGHYGLSNHLLNTPWPKVVRAKNALHGTEALNQLTDISKHLLTALQDQEIAADENLPSTGISIEFERLLSAPFISSPIYGTRTSTVVLIEKKIENRQVYFHERQYQQNVNHFKDQTFTFTHP